MMEHKMSDLSNLHIVQNQFESVGKTLDIGDILKDRDLARHFNHSSARGPSSLTVVCDAPTAKTSVRRAAEKLFILTPPPAKAPTISGYRVEQEYEGTVVAVDTTNGIFTARLADISGSGPDEEGEFSFAELNGDEPFVVPGAVFTWSIGLQTRGASRRQQRVSDLRFRRMPAISKDLIATAEREAQALSAYLIETESDTPFTSRRTAQTC